MEKTATSTTGNLLWIWGFFIVVLFIMTFVWAWWVVAGKVNHQAPSAASNPELINARIAPVGRVNTSDAPVAVAAVPAAPAEPRSGEAVYNATCQVCHATGISNAPILGNQQAWAPRVAKGKDQLLASIKNGVPGTAMAAKGTCGDCTDDELAATLDFMLSKLAP